MNRYAMKLEHIISHAISLMQEATTDAEVRAIQNVLEQGLALAPGNPDILVWLGLVSEVAGEVAQGHSFYRDALQQYSQRYENEPRSNTLLNCAITHYRLGDSHALNEILPSAEQISSSDYIAWMTFCYLYIFLGRFGDSLVCAEHALSVSPGDPDALIAKALSLEGLARFDSAIELLEEMLRTKLPDHALLEAHHVLSHLLIERRRTGDIPKADMHMRKAVAIDSDYVICLGSIHAESRRYSQAVRIFNKALSDPNIYVRPEFCAELKFYRGQAFWGLEDYESAKADFEAYERFYCEHGHTDNVVHARNHLVKLQLKRKGLSDLSIEELPVLVKSLEEFAPSLFAHANIHTERALLLETLELYRTIGRMFTVSPSERKSDDLFEIRDRFESLHSEFVANAVLYGTHDAELRETGSQMKCLVFSRSPYNRDSVSPAIKYAHIFYDEDAAVFSFHTAGNHKPVPTPKLYDLFDAQDILIFDGGDGIEIHEAFFLGAFQGKKSMIYVTSSNAPSYLDDSIPRVNALEDALLLAQIALFYESVRKMLTGIPPWPGVVYYNRTPSLSISPQNPLPLRVQKALKRGAWNGT